MGPNIVATNNVDKDLLRMGQAKQRGSKDERIAQAQQRPDKEPDPHPASPAAMMKALMDSQRLNPLFDRLTTPENLDDRVMQFAKQLSDSAPIFLECEPELWSRQSCCDLNVKEYIREHGGRMLCGYRIWYAEPQYIEGERHAVWTDGETIRDVSFVDTGETQVVFVPDDRTFDDAPGKVRFAFEEADKKALAAHEKFFGAVPVEKMADDKAWNSYPSYESWLAGKRMPNMVLGTRGEDIA